MTRKSRSDEARELIELLQHVDLHGIGGREPNVDWHHIRPKDKNLTMCLRLTIKDRSFIVRSLRAYAGVQP